VGSSILTLILIPDTVKIIIWSYSAYKNLKIDGFNNYNAVNTLFVAFFFFTVGISIHTIKLTIKIRQKYKKVLK
jgi:hypothetical protein